MGGTGVGGAGVCGAGVCGCGGGAGYRSRVRAVTLYL